MEFVAATNNQKKLKEIRRILEASGHSVISLQEAGVDSEPEENGLSFAENALIKAKAACEATGKAAIGDDSGLVVDALDGAPGIYSARFAGEQHNDADNNEKLLRLLADVPQANRTARFVCSICLVLPNGKTLGAEGTCEGAIGFSASGNGGFGYDPLFYVGDKSFADFTAEEKDEISHRGVALRRFSQELPAFLGE